MSLSTTTQDQEIAILGPRLAVPKAHADESLHNSVVGAVIRIGTTNGANGAEGPALKRAHRSFGWESLRESEIGVAELVADGLTNREIGARLFLSRHTVDSHLRHIFWKLGINSRVGLTRLVVEHGMSSPRIADDLVS